MRKIGSGRSLFLLEIAILFLFFIISVVICVSLFVYSGERNDDANALNSAVIKAVSIADTLKACPDEDEARQQLAANYPFRIYYDENWNTGGEKVYYADIHLREEQYLRIATISFFRMEDKKQFYQLETKEFLGVVKP